jgi:hypothetical protein
LQVSLCTYMSFSSLSKSELLSPKTHIVSFSRYRLLPLKYIAFGNIWESQCFLSSPKLIIFFWLYEIVMYFRWNFIFYGYWWLQCLFMLCALGFFVSLISGIACLLTIGLFALFFLLFKTSFYNLGMNSSLIIISIVSNLFSIYSLSFILSLFLLFAYKDVLTWVRQIYHFFLSCFIDYFVFLKMFLRNSSLKNIKCF